MLGWQLGVCSGRFLFGFCMPLREYLVPRPQVAGAHFSHRRRLHAVSLCPVHLGFAAHWPG